MIELCLLVSPGYEDTTAGCYLDGTMDGAPYRKVGYALDLRMHLWAEHLGFEGLGLTVSAEHQREIQDAVSDATYHGIWRDTASNNARAFAEALSD